MKNFNKYLYLLFVMIWLLSSCSAYAKESAPYYINADFVMENNSSDYQMCGVDLYFLNKTKKKINEFTVVFYLFDEDGEPISEGKSNIVLNINREIDENQTFFDCISLDKYFNGKPDSKCLIDYLYVSRIVYEDGSLWNDPFGMICF